MRASRRTLLAKTLPALLLLPVTASCRKQREFSCASTEGLSSDEAAARQALGYVDRTPHRQQTCERCRHWVSADDGCGGCKIMKGPVHPLGYCNAFTPSG